MDRHRIRLLVPTDPCCANASRRMGEADQLRTLTLVMPRCGARRTERRRSCHLPASSNGVWDAVRHHAANHATSAVSCAGRASPACSVVLHIELAHDSESLLGCARKWTPALELTERHDRRLAASPSGLPARSHVFGTAPPTRPDHEVCCVQRGPSRSEYWGTSSAI